MTLKRPDEEMEACGCSDLKLEYDPNDEPHTVFTCDTELEWKPSPTAKVITWVIIRLNLVKSAIFQK